MISGRPRGSEPNAPWKTCGSTAGAGGRRRGGQDEPDQHRAGVTHEDPGREEVVRQEAEAGAGQRRRQQGGYRGQFEEARLGKVEGEGEERGGRDSCHAGGQTVEAIDEVDCVDRQDSEQDGHRDCQVGPEADRSVAPGQVDIGELHTAERDHHAGRRHLPGQLRDRVQLEPVVDDAEEADQGGRNDDPREVRPSRERAAQRGQPACDKDGCAQPGEQRDSPHPGRRDRMHVAITRPRHRTPGHRHPPGERGGQVRDGRADKGDEQVLQPRVVGDRHVGGRSARRRRRFRVAGVRGAGVRGVCSHGRCVHDVRDDLAQLGHCDSTGAQDPRAARPSCRRSSTAARSRPARPRGRRRPSHRAARAPQPPCAPAACPDAVRAGHRHRSGAFEQLDGHGVQRHPDRHRAARRRRDPRTATGRAGRRGSDRPARTPR